MSQSQVINAQGWTVLTPSADSRMIYVSSSTGNDANSGLSESQPKKTITAALNIARKGYPDWVMLKSGDVWAERYLEWNRSGRSATERAVLTSYGSGPRPVISKSGFLYWGPNEPAGAILSNVAWMNLNFQGDKSTNPATLSVKAFLCSGRMQNILIEGCRFNDFTSAMDFQYGSSVDGTTNLAIRRNEFSECGGMGLFTSHLNDMLLEENIFDHCGWFGGASSTKHNAYLFEIKRLIARGNIFSRGSNFGLKMSADNPSTFTDFIIEDNLFIKNAFGLDHSAGVKGDPFTTYTHENGQVKRNVFTQMGNGINQDLVGWLLNSRAVVWDGNLFVHKPAVSSGIILNWDGHHKDITVKNSVVYDWALGTGRVEADYLEWNKPKIDGYTLTGNQINMPAVSYADPSRSVGSYYASIGGTDDATAFVTAAMSHLSRDTFDTKYTAASVNEYLRAGFALASPTIDPPAPSTLESDVHEILTILRWLKNEWGSQQ